MVVVSGTGSTRVVPDKGPLNGCVCVCSKLSCVIDRHIKSTAVSISDDVLCRVLWCSVCIVVDACVGWLVVKICWKTFRLGLVGEITSQLVLQVHRSTSLCREWLRVSMVDVRQSLMLSEKTSLVCKLKYYSPVFVEHIWFGRSRCHGWKYRDNAGKTIKEVTVISLIRMH